MTAPAAVCLDPIARACIMVKGGLGMCHPIDAHDIRFEVQQYAQYRSALQVSFRPNRARRRSYIMLTSLPFLCILDTDKATAERLRSDPFGERTNVGGAVVSRARYMSCDPAWVREFDDAVAAAGVRVLRDFREWNANA